MNDTGFSVRSGLGSSHYLLPCLTTPDGAGANGVRHQRRTLRIDLAGADGVMADFGITHIVVGRHTDSGAMRPQQDVRAFRKQLIQYRLAGNGNGTAGIRTRHTVAVHDNGHDRA